MLRGLLAGCRRRPIRTANVCRSGHSPPVPQAQDNQLPNGNGQVRKPDGQTRQQSQAAAGNEKKRQIAEESATLLKLATDLKSEVDKTNKDTLSLNVIRKADEIEKLARSVKEKMKVSVGPS